LSALGAHRPKSRMATKVSWQKEPWLARDEEAEGTSLMTGSAISPL